MGSAARRHRRWRLRVRSPLVPVGLALVPLAPARLLDGDGHSEVAAAGALVGCLLAGRGGHTILVERRDACEAAHDPARQLLARRRAAGCDLDRDAPPCTYHPGALGLVRCHRLRAPSGGRGACGFRVAGVRLVVAAGCAQAGRRLGSPWGLREHRIPGLGSSHRVDWLCCRCAWTVVAVVAAGEVAGREHRDAAAAPAGGDAGGIDHACGWRGQRRGHGRRSEQCERRGVGGIPCEGVPS
mmetsp:Transcript_112032/g.356059  ORF Transcript_112032/g.356059 Transcript_112032/m.356059 type:complete len:241 (-) Transcript_112032:2878-3600(-)